MLLLWKPLTGNDLPVLPPITVQDATESLILASILVTVATYGILKHRAPKEPPPKRKSTQAH